MADYSLSLGGETNTWPSLSVGRKKHVEQDPVNSISNNFINSLFDISPGIKTKPQSNATMT